ncbi:hypothetical protein MAPG_07073 [Magnaporthiopsis poae ATCC 64411]|uniref:Uncharacterized protein n=1 Tax=Magnaporthiopsis poae (strain ATCC 64411 / 73-15) TaxID=644358 RepID=A0A0C4E3Q6_MAGP6|nr:hypothetical protein MAPG_07073 [Magnaporthiopsis poae ATCC 64411]
MHPSTLLVTMAAAAATAVLAIPLVDNSDLGSHMALSPRGLFFSKPKPKPAVKEPEPAGPPETCPTITTKKAGGPFTATGDGHCCQPGEKNALNCCTLGNTPRLPNTSEYPCRSKSFQTAEAWQNLFECNTHIQHSRWCTAALVPRLNEILTATMPKKPKYNTLNPLPKEKAAPPSNVPAAARKAMEANSKGARHPTYRPNPGKSRLGRFPDGDPDPADSKPADSKPAA